jgi:hypothetical protein
MPSEPDNKMNDLLKAYAKKRRDEAGVPLEMHPATRRLLQEETAKLRPKPREQSPSWLSLLAGYWPRLAFAASIVMVFGVTIWMFRGTSEKTGGTMHLAKQDAPIAPAQQPASPREFFRDAELATAPRPVKEGAETPVKLGDEAERETLARSEGGVEKKVLAELTTDRLAGEPAVRQKSAEMVKNEAAKDVSRDLQLRAPAIAPPAAPATPVAAAPAEAASLARANRPAPSLPSASRTAEPARQLGLAIESKDKSGLATVSGNTLAAGKSASLGDQVKPESLTVASDDLRLNAQSLTLSYSANSSAADSGYLENNKLQSYDSFALLPGAVAPPTDGRSQAAFSLTTNSLANNSLFGQSLTFNAGGYGFANQALPAEANAGALPAAASVSSASKPTASIVPSLKEADAKGGRADFPDNKSVALQQDTPLAQSEARFYRTVAASPEQQGQATARNRFTQTRQTPPADPAKRTANPGETILANFELQQSAERLRVVDADGSIYDGEVLADAPAAGDKSRGAVSQQSLQAGRKLAEPRPTDVGAPVGQIVGSGSESPAWNFRVSGTNRTLRQPVVVQGVLWTGEEVGQAAGGALNQTPGAAPRAAPMPARPTSQAQNGVAAQSNLGRQSTTMNQSGQAANLLNVRRIQGQVRVGAANETTLDAVRAEK